MAGGYLGKISAVISANTGDYVRKLNESAKETRAFATTVQNTLSRASRDAAKSLESIYTPLQNVERALRAAASERLAFRGFDGVVRDVQSLQRALAKLQDQRTIDLVVKTSGLGSIEELKRTLNVLRNQDVTVGVEGLRAQRAALGNTNNFVVTTQVREEGQRLDSVIEALERIDAESIKRISIQVEDAQLAAATAQFRRLTELSTQIGAPLAKAQSEFSGLAGTIQSQFISAFAKTQSAYEQFQQRIKEGAEASSAEFRGLAADVRVVEAAIGRLKETAAAGGRLFSGEELTFVRPQVVDELNRLAEAQGRLAKAPAGVRSSPIASELLRDGKVLEEQINRISARIERLNAEGLDITVSQAGLDLAIRRLQEVRRLTDQVASVGERDAEIEANIGAATQLLSLEDPTGRSIQQRLQDGLALREADEARAAAARAAAEADEVAARGAQLRAQAAGQLLTVLQRESKLISAEGLASSTDPTGRSIQQRLRDIRDQEIAANVGASSQRFTPLPAGYLERGAIDQANRQLGSAVDSPDRAFGQLLGTITSLKGQLDSLPAGVRQQFTPAVAAAEAEYKKLFATAGATADEIEAARLRMQQLSDQTAIAAGKLASVRGVLTGFGGVGVEGITAGLDARAVQVFAAQMTVLQGVMAGVSGPAAGALAAAFDNVRNRIAQAADDGTIRLRATRESIDGMIQALGTASAKAAGLDVSRVSNDLKRVGDIGRRGFDNFALAAQQAGFAIDDFFSVTGDLDQRIRAVSNNVTQLAFILGSTKGLFIALGAVVATQVVLMYRKWANEGKTTEDKVKALNESLLAQKGIVDRLKQSFDSLGDAITRSTISDKAEQKAGIEKSISSIVEQRRKAATEAVLDADPDTRAARGARAKAERDREKATTLGQRAAAQAAIDEAESRIRRNERAARILPAPDDREVEAALAMRRVPLGRNRAPVPDLPAGMGIDALRARRQALTAPIENVRQRLLDESRSGTGGDLGLRGRLLGESYERLQSLAARLDAAISAFTDNGIPDLARAAAGVGDVLRTAQDVAKEAAAAGTIGSSSFQSQVDAAGAALRAAIDELEKATNMPAGPDREQAVEQAKQSVEAAKALGDAIKLQTPAVEAATSSILKFSEAIGRVTAEADATLNAARSAASNAVAEELGGRTARTTGARERAERDARRAQRLRDDIAFAAAGAQERARQSPVAIQLEREIKELDKALETETDPDKRLAFAIRRSVLQQRSEAIIRDAVDSDPLLQERRAAAIEEEQRRRNAIAGRELMLSPGQRARLDLERQISQVEAGRQSRLDEDALLNAGGRQVEINREADDAIKRLREEAFRSTAPAILALADSVQTALLQGPSRAALQASDVSTVEGSRELSRLLRGDDAARNQDLVQLQKEANRLLDLIANNPANVAN